MVEPLGHACSARCRSFSAATTAIPACAAPASAVATTHYASTLTTSHSAAAIAAAHSAAAIVTAYSAAAITTTFATSTLTASHSVPPFASTGPSAAAVAATAIYYPAASAHAPSRSRGTRSNKIVVLVESGAGRLSQSHEWRSPRDLSGR